MSDRSVIRTEDLGKRYRIRTRTAASEKRWWRRTDPATHWAVRGIDLEVPAGQIIGLIGPNGAGKSTLLQLLARTTAPSEGRFSIAGRVASMLEVGVGFSWELTGRENIYLCGTLLGMRRHEVSSRLDEIISFAGIEEYLDVPVKRYSSGMYVRLGFSVAAHLEADVMLVDEVLSVGDASFRAQCMSKMREGARNGRTIVYVSHGLGTVREFCDRAVLLDHGSVQADGSVVEVIAKYLHVEQGPHFIAKDLGTTQVRSVRMASAEGTGRLFDAEAPLQIEIEYELKNQAPGCSLIAAIAGPDGPPVLTSRSDHAGFALQEAEGVHRTTMEVPPGHLSAGEYHVALALLDGAGEVLWSSDCTATFALTGAPEEVPGFPAGSGRLRLACPWQ